MLIALAVGAWTMWTIGVTVYYCMTYYWTAFRYMVGAILVAHLGGPALMVGFEPGATTTELVASLIWIHLGGSILTPHIFGLTVLPVLLFLQFKK